MKIFYRNTIIILFIFVFIIFYGCKKENTSTNKDSINVAEQNNLDSLTIDSRWALYYTDKEQNRHYYDTKTIEHKSGGQFNENSYIIWTMVIYNKERVFDYNNTKNEFAWCKGKKYSKKLYYLTLNCKNKEVLINESEVYFAEGNMLVSKPYDTYKISPESSEEKLFEVLCGGLK